MKIICKLVMLSAVLMTSCKHIVTVHKAKSGKGYYLKGLNYVKVNHDSSMYHVCCYDEDQLFNTKDEAMQAKKLHDLYCESCN